MVFEEKGIYTVHEFTLAVKSILTDGKFNDVWIRGEISNLTNHYSGHRYFKLKDKNSLLKCVMFRSSCKNLRFEPEDGMKVVVLGNLDVYVRDGIYQLNVRAIRPDGIGELYKAFEALKNKLELEGLFAPEHKKPLPKFPEKIGVATSESGAVLHDILTVVKRRYPLNILFIPTIVQGEYAAQSIVRSIELLNKTDVDVIILGRGGGSIEDLWAFNEEIVARAVFNSRIPIISAVGHETDNTIADFVADKRAPTPSAAAEIAVLHRREELVINICGLSEQLIKSQRRFIKGMISRVSELQAKVELDVFMESLDNSLERVEEIMQRQIRGIRGLLVAKRTLFNAHADRLDAVSPLATLLRGYSVVLKLPDKKVVRSIGEVEKRDELEIIVNDGKIKCDVNEKEVYEWK